MKRLFLVSVINLIITLGAFSQNSWNTTLISHWGYGPCMTASADNDYIYMGNGCMFLVIDKSDPSQLIEVDELLLQDHISEIALTEDYAFVANDEAGLRIINRSNPSSSFEEGFCNTPGHARGVVVSGSYAYIADGYEGLRIINISDPTAPFEEGYYSTPGLANRIAISGNYAYVADFSSLRIINISNPETPYEVGYYDTPGTAYDVSILDNYAYIADQQEGLRVVDISNPAVPFEVGFLTTTDIVCSISVSGSYAYTGDYDGLRIINISNPSSPYEEGYCDLPGEGDRNVTILDSYAFVADTYEGLHLVNISNVAEPFPVGFYETAGPAMDIAVSGSYACIAAGFDGLRIINISDPTNPYEEGYFNTFASTWSVDISGSYAYLACDYQGLRIIDISNPATPFQIGHCDTDRAYGVTVSGIYAYIADNDYGLSIINISNPTAPYEEGSYDTPGYAQNVAISGSFAYVADGFEGLRIINVSNPVAPFEVGYYDTPNFVLDVVVSGSYAYIADFGDALRIININNPAAPFEEGYYITPGYVRSVAVLGSYAYIADEYEGLRIINITNPATPFEEGYYDTPGESYGVAGSEYFAYLADGHAGMEIIRNDLLVPPATLITDPPGAIYCEGGYGILFGVGDSENGINYTLQRNEGTWQDMENITGNGDTLWFVNYYLEGQYNDYRLIDELNNISETIQISEIALPAGGVVSPGNTIGCAPFEICFDLVGVENNHPSTVYIVDFGDGSPPETYTHPPPESVCHTYLTTSCQNPGEEFLFTLEISNICDNVVNVIGGIEVYTSPVALFEVDSTGGCVGEEICFQNLTDPGFIVNCSTYATYTWDFGDGTAPLISYTLDDVCHVYMQPGTYLVSLNVENSCGISNYVGEVNIDECTGVSGNYISKGISVYPNPNNGSFTIELSSEKDDKINIRVINILGESVYEKRNISFNKKHLENINLMNQSAGLYYVMVTGETTKVTRKIVLRE